MARMGEYCREVDMTMDPARITPLPGHALIKRKPGRDKIGRIFLPENRKEQADEGTVVAIRPKPVDDAENLRPGDHVWFSPHTNIQDSVFLGWKGEQYVLIPTETILLGA